MTGKPKLSTIVLSKEDVERLYLATYKLNVPIYTEHVLCGVYYTTNNRRKLFSLILELTKFFDCMAEELPSLERLHSWNIATNCKKSLYYEVKSDVALFMNGEARKIDARKYWLVDALHTLCKEEDFMHDLSSCRINAAKTIQNLAQGESVTIPIEGTSERAIREAIRREHINKRGKYTTKIKYEIDSKGYIEQTHMIVSCHERT